MKKRLLIFALSLFLMAGCAGMNAGGNKKLIDGDPSKMDYSTAAMYSMLVQLDADANGAIDRGKGGTNTTTVAGEQAALSIDHLHTLSGRPEGSDDLGTGFTGTTIPDSANIVAALQALETAVELRWQESTMANGSNYPTISNDAADDTINEMFAAIEIWAAALATPNESVVESYIFDSDAATVTGIWKNNDDVCRNFGSDNDLKMCWNAADARFEFRDSSDNPIFWFDPANKQFSITAVINPEMGLYDSNATGTARSDQYAGGLSAELTTVTPDATYSNVIIKYMKNSVPTAGITVNGEGDEVDIGSLAFVTTGKIHGQIYVSSKTASTYTIGTDDAHEAYGAYFVNGDNDAIAFTIPAAAVGMSGCVGQGDGVSGAITLDNTADYFIKDGVKAAQGEALVSSGSAEDQICWIALSASIIKITSYQGTWAEETP